MVRNAQVQKFTGDDKILEAWLLVGKIRGVYRSLACARSNPEFWPIQRNAHPALVKNEKKWS